MKHFGKSNEKNDAYVSLELIELMINKLENH